MAALVVTAGTASAQMRHYATGLSGALEAPPNASPATGWAHVWYDPMAHSLRLETWFEGLLGTTTAAHIHCCITLPFDASLTAGVATQTPSFIGFPLGATTGSYDNTFDLTLASSWNAAFIAANGGTTAGAEARLISGLESGRAYLNVHTSFRPGGEIRGFFAVVPEPSTYVLMATGLLGVAGIGWRKRRVG